MKRIIVNADDFGLHSSINEGIIMGHQEGIITSTSLLAVGEAFDEAVVLGKKESRLGVGIHLALVGGLPPLGKKAEVSSLVDERGFFPELHTEVIKRVLQGQVNFTQVFDELDRQFLRCMESGLPITHVDGHQHLHMLPEILYIVVALMKKYGINKLRIPGEMAFFFNGNFDLARIAGRNGLTYLSKRAKARIRPFYFYYPRYFWGMINGGKLTKQALMGILREVNNKAGTHEIMAHPGKDNLILAKRFDWGYHWEEEFEALCSSEVKKYIKERDIHLIHYGELT